MVAKFDANQLNQDLELGPLIYYIVLSPTYNYGVACKGALGSRLTSTSTLAKLTSHQTTPLQLLGLLWPEK